MAFVSSPSTNWNVDKTVASLDGNHPPDINLTVLGILGIPVMNWVASAMFSRSGHDLLVAGCGGGLKLI
jgi:hypothetical protein